MVLRLLGIAAVVGGSISLLGGIQVAGAQPLLLSPSKCQGNHSVSSSNPQGTGTLTCFGMCIKCPGQDSKKSTSCVVFTLFTGTNTRTRSCVCDPTPASFSDNDESGDECSFQNEPCTLFQFLAFSAEGPLIEVEPPQCLVAACKKTCVQDERETKPDPNTGSTALVKSCDCRTPKKK